MALVRTIRSYAVETDDGDLHRIEVREIPNTGLRIQVRTPVTAQQLDGGQRGNHINAVPTTNPTRNPEE